MKEQEFLNYLGETYGGVSTPQDCAVEFTGIAKRIVRCAKIDKAQKPPTLESCLLTYYVKDVGTATEEVCVSPSISNPDAVREVKATYEAAVAKLPKD